MLTLSVLDFRLTPHEAHVASRTALETPATTHPTTSVRFAPVYHARCSCGHRCAPSNAGDSSQRRSAGALATSSLRLLALTAPPATFHAAPAYLMSVATYPLAWIALIFEATLWLAL